ncbi:PQQ-binding-like beta-propeller repeat protein [uncultured Methanobacterium sp.]|uniref:right-handed parallel beta-helix repeat-containing protein n=1 Tax=uncultured Methanobacterium sp. TaxID=176306 RepID=UPI002AA79B73|nr:PQQ-binding-like beta-propeller repeat protein [uncultured Methanobacterium sp.]
MKSLKIYLLVVIFVIFFVSAVGCASAADNETNSTALADSDWPSFHNDANNTGQSDYSGPQTNTTKWTFSNLTVYGSAVIGSDGMVYVGGNDGVLYVFNKEGILQWTWATRSQIFGSPTLGNDGTIYVSNWMNSTTYAINPNGTLIWKYTTGDYNFGSSPVIGSDGTIYITVTTETTGTLYAISSSGVVKWKYSMGLLWGNSPVIGVDGTIYVVDYDGIMYAINPNGTLKWSYRLIKTGTNNRPIYYVNMRFDTPSIGPDGTIYVANSGTSTVSGGTLFKWYYLFAIVDDGVNGSLKWVYNRNYNDQGDNSSRSILEPVYGAPAISSTGTIYIVSASKIYAISPTGSLLWTYDTGGSDGNGLTSAVIGADGTIYVGGRNGLFALIDNGSSATLKWHYDTGDIAGSPAIGNNGTLYVGTTTGTFYAFNDIGSDFTVKIVNGTALTQQFTGTTTGIPASWKWDFGDGNTSNQQNPQHAYSKPGIYEITLNVTLNNGTILTRTRTVNIEEMDIIAPTADASLNSGTYDYTQNALLTATDNSGNVTIYYTTDGTDPRTSSTRKIYSNPLVINQATTLNFAAVDSSGNWSPAYTRVYNILHVVYVQDASYYNSQTLNSDIQSILDNVYSGSTVIFLGTFYENLQLVVNKQLNIISNVGTWIVTNSQGTAVFIIKGTQAAGTCINGFNIITNTTSCILVTNTSDVDISNVQATSNRGSAISINGSCNTTVQNSNLSNSSVGIQVSNSKDTQLNGNIISGNQKNGVDIENSTITTINGGTISNNLENGVNINNSHNTTINGTVITDNGQSAAVGSGKGAMYIAGSENVQVTNSQITGNGYGIFTNGINGVTIDHNTISDNVMDGVLLNGETLNSFISTNYIQRNRNGIQINGSNDHLTINGNLITDSRYADPDYMYSGQGVSFGAGSIPSSSLVLNHNLIENNPRRSIETRYGPNTYFKGSNWFTVPDCFHNTLDPQIGMKLIQTGDSSFKFVFYDGNDENEVVTDLVPIDVLFYLNDDMLIIKTTKGTIYLNYPVTELFGTMRAVVYGRSVAISIFNQPIASGANVTEGLKYHLSQPTKQDTIISQTSMNDGIQGGFRLISGSGSGSVFNGSGVFMTPAIGAIGAISNPASASNQGKTVQELVKENQDVTYGGIVLIILMIIIVGGVYYRKDIQSMIEKSRK